MALLLQCLLELLILDHLRRHELLPQMKREHILEHLRLAALQRSLHMQLCALDDFIEEERVHLAQRLFYR